MKFEEQIHERDEVLLHARIDLEMAILDLDDHIFDHLDDISAKSHWIIVLTQFLLS